MADPGTSFELAKAYVAIMPSLKDLRPKLSREFKKAIPDIKELGEFLADSFSAGLGDKIAVELRKAKNALSGAFDPLHDAVKKSTKGLGEALEAEVRRATPEVSKFGKALQKSTEVSGAILRKSLVIGPQIAAPFNKAMLASVRTIGGALHDTVSLATRTATAGVAAAVGAVGAQVIGGGLNRALGINASEAKLQALGYQGKEFQSIMQSASEAVDGTAFALSDSVGATSGLLAAGIKPGKELTGILKNAGKLADISGRSFADMGSLLAKNAASGVVQMDDLNQLMDAGVPITSYLAKNLGKSVAEIKKMSSAGKISFKDLNNAVNSIDFDSALLASKDVGLALRNVRSQLSKVGANLWTPIIDGLLPILITARTFIMEFSKSFNFNPIQTKLADGMKKVGSIFDRFEDATGKISGKKIGEDLDKIIVKFESFKEKISGFEGPIVGALIGISGSMLSGIPLIGPLFAGVTPLVGLFGGTLFQAHKDSKKLQETVKGLGKWVGNLGDKMIKSFTGNKDDDFMKNFGDGLSDNIEKVKVLITDAVDTISGRWPEIKKAFKDMWKAFTDAFAEGEKITGKDIGNAVVDIVQTFAGYMEKLAPIVIGLAITAASIVKSDEFKQIFDWLANFAGTVALNEGLLKTLGISLITLFVGGKLTIGTMAFIGFIKKMKLPAGTKKKVVAPGEAVGSFGSSLKKGMSSIIKSSLYIMAGIAVLAIIITEIAWIGSLMSDPKMSENIKKYTNNMVVLFDGIGDSLAGIVDSIMPLLGIVKDLLLDIVKVLGQTLVAVVDAIGDDLVKITDAILINSTKVIEAVGDGMAKVTEATYTGKAKLTEAVGGLAGEVLSGISDLTLSLSVLLDGLAENGVKAGAGAYAAAGGISALMLAFGLGSAAAGVGNHIGTILSAMVGQDSPLETMLQAIERLSNVSETVLNMPELWGGAVAQAFTFGVAIPNSIANGILSQSDQMKNALITQVDSMLEATQQHLDANPLIISANVNESNFGGGPIGAGTGSGNTSVSNRTYNMNVPSNTDAIESLLRYGR